MRRRGACTGVPQPLGLLMILVLLASWMPLATDAQPCSGLVVALAKLKGRPAPAVGFNKAGDAPTVRAGGRVKVVAVLTNAGATTLRNVTLRLQLPDYLIPKRAALQGKVGQKRPLVENVRALYWTGLTLTPHKARKARVLAWVPGCQNASISSPPLAVQASAYVVANDSDVTCLTEATPARLRVRPRLSSKTPPNPKPCTPPPPPVPIPADADYVYYASGQKCKDAIRAPLRLLRDDDRVDAHSSTNRTSEECTYVSWR